MPHTIIIISNDRLDLLPELAKEFARENVRILTDRRQRQRRQRRQRDRSVTRERRRAARRRRTHDITSDLETFGFAVVAIPEP